MFPYRAVSEPRQQARQGGDCRIRQAQRRQDFRCRGGCFRVGRQEDRADAHQRYDTGQAPDLRRDAVFGVDHNNSGVGGGGGQRDRLWNVRRPESLLAGIAGRLLTECRIPQTIDSGRRPWLSRHRRRSVNAGRLRFQRDRMPLCFIGSLESPRRQSPIADSRPATPTRCHCRAPFPGGGPARPSGDVRKRLTLRANKRRCGASAGYVSDRTGRK